MNFDIIDREEISMISIAICDDEKNDRDHIRSLIGKIAEENKFTIDIKEYQMLPDRFPDEDILLLDIEFVGNEGAENGIKLAERIRKHDQKQPIIIFITGYDKYVFDAFDVNAFNYLVKPINEGRFSKVMVAAIQKTIKTKDQQKRTIEIHHNGTVLQLPEKDIVFAESQNHKMLIHTKTTIIEDYGKLSDLEERVEDVFFRVHRSFLVNLLHVESYSRSEITMDNGEKVLISKYKYSGFVKNYMNLLRKGESF